MFFLAFHGSFHNPLSTWDCSVLSSRFFQTFCLCIGKLPTLFIAAAQALLLLLIEVHRNVLQADLFKANISCRTNSRHKPDSPENFTHLNTTLAHVLKITWTDP